jgi:hypothetical protein
LVRLLLRELQALFVGTFFVPDELEEERDVVGAALVADPLDPRVLDVVDVLGVFRRVIEQNLDAVSAGFLEPFHRPLVEQIRQPPRTGLVVAGLLVRHQQAGFARATLARRDAELGIQQNRARVAREYLGDEDLELFERPGVDVAAFFLGQRFLERTPLIHRRRCDDAPRIRHGLHSRKLPRCELHDRFSLCKRVSLSGAVTCASMSRQKAQGRRQKAPIRPTCSCCAFCLLP